MKNLKKYVVVAWVLIAVAGVAWASRPATEPKPAAAVASEAVGLEGLLDELSQSTQGACCVADCRNEYSACKDTCNWVPSCIQQVCYPEFVECADGC